MELAAHLERKEIISRLVLKKYLYLKIEEPFFENLNNNSITAQSFFSQMLPLEKI